MIAALPEESPARKLLAKPTTWPLGLVTAKDGGNRNLGSSQHQRSFDLNIFGPVAPFFAGITIALDPQQRTIVGLDGLGAERFRAHIEPGPKMSHGWGGGAGFNNYPTLNYVRTSGNLLVVWDGQQVLGVDTLRPGNNQKRVMWNQDLAEQLPGLPMHAGYSQRQINAPWGGLPQRFVAQDGFGNLIGNMGPVNYDGVCFQRFKDLKCVDPLTGDVLWTRKNVPLGCDVFGDEEILFVAPPNGGEALVLRALDGQLLGKRPIGPLEQRMATIGRARSSGRPPTRRPSTPSQVVTLRDNWTGDVKWSHTFKPGAKGAVVAGEVVGVLEPSGRFILVRLADGHRLAEHQLEPEEKLTGICLLRSSDQYLLVTNSPVKQETDLTYNPAPGGLNDPMINGRVYALDRETGGLRWPQPVVVQQQGLVLTQPCELPLLFFLSHRTKATPSSQHETKSVVQVIDKRNGRDVFKKDDLPLVVQNFSLSGDHDSNTVTLALTGNTFTFQLTDQPLPPLAEPPAAAKSGLLDGLGAILRSIERSAPPGGQTPPGRGRRRR